jgi:hypothetical protein
MSPVSGSRAAPHALQKRASGGLAVPHASHAGASAAPQAFTEARRLRIGVAAARAGHRSAAICPQRRCPVQSPARRRILCHAGNCVRALAGAPSGRPKGALRLLTPPIAGREQALDQSRAHNGANWRLRPGTEGAGVAMSVTPHPIPQRERGDAAEQERHDNQSPRRERRCACGSTGARPALSWQITLLERARAGGVAADAVGAEAGSTLRRRGAGTALGDAVGVLLRFPPEGGVLRLAQSRDGTAWHQRHRLQPAKDLLSDI